MIHKSGLVLALALMSLSACSGVQGNGKKGEEKRKVETFSELEVNGGFHVALQLDGPSEGEVTLNLSGDENLLPLWKTTVSQGRLRFHAEKQLWTDLPLTVEARMPPLKNVLFQGSAEGTLKGISGDKFVIETSGSSDLALEGTIKELEIHVSGSGQINAYGLKAEKVLVKISGSGAAQVQAAAKLQVDISGSGKVEYWGSPAEVVQNISGSGELVKK